MNQILLPIGLTWAIMQGYEMYSTLKDKPVHQMPLAFFNHVWMCSKCMSFWLTLAFTQNLGLAALVSIGFSVYSHFTTR